MMDKNTIFKQWFYRSKQWMYRDRKPNRVAKFLNRFWAIVGAHSNLFSGLVTLDVVGRKSGQVISFPLVMVTVNGQRYLASMLGEGQWVRNVRASGGRATLRSSGQGEDVWLEETPIEERAPILKVYLRAAPGARPHVSVDMNAPLAEFEAIAARYPVFRVIPA